MTARSTTVAALRRWDKWAKGRGRRRPGRTMRLLALAVLFVFIYALPDAQGWNDRLWAAWSLLMAGFIAIAPKPFFDGRLERWSEQHKRLSSVLMTLFMVPMTALVLSAFAADWKFMTILLGGLGCLAVIDLTRRVRRAAVDEASPSDADGEASSR